MVSDKSELACLSDSHAAQLTRKKKDKGRFRRFKPRLRRPRVAEALADSRRPEPLASDEAQVASATKAEGATNLIQIRNTLSSTSGIHKKTSDQL